MCVLARVESDDLTALTGDAANILSPVHGGGRAMNLKIILMPLLLMGLTVRAEEPPVQPPDMRLLMGGAVNVLGEVNKPSRISLPRFCTLLDAIASAGGLTKSADARTVLIIHKSCGDKPDTTEVNLAAILAGTSQDVLLRTGDTIVVRAIVVIE
jgi:hypothetical protein